MTGIFKRNNPINHFILLLYGVALKLPSFLYPEVPVPQHMDGVVYRLLLRWMLPLGENTPVVFPILSFILVYIQAIAINNLVKHQRLMQKQSYLPGMTYLLFTSLFTEWQTFSAPVIVNTLMIWVLAQLCNLNNSTRPKTILFNIGLAIGLSSFFYFPTVIFCLLIVLGIFLTRPFVLPEWLMVLLGGLTPYYFFAAWVFLTNRWDNFKIPAIKVVKPYFFQSTISYIAVGLILITVLVGAVFVQSNLRRQLVQTRKNWTLIFVYLVVAFFIPFINTNDRVDYWVLVAVPATIIGTAAFLYPTRKWFGFVLHWSMVATIITLSYFLP